MAGGGNMNNKVHQLPLMGEYRKEAEEVMAMFWEVFGDRIPEMNRRAEEAEKRKRRSHLRVVK